jgi:hypothetical protein
VTPSAPELTDPITHGEIKSAVEQMYQATSIAPRTWPRSSPSPSRDRGACRSTRSSFAPPGRRCDDRNVRNNRYAREQPHHDPYLKLNNGVEMPAVGLGVFQTPPDDARAAVRATLGGGVPAESTELVAAG